MVGKWCAAVLLALSFSPSVPAAELRFLEVLREPAEYGGAYRYRTLMQAELKAPQAQVDGYLRDYAAFPCMNPAIEQIQLGEQLDARRQWVSSVIDVCFGPFCWQLHQRQVMTQEHAHLLKAELDPQQSDFEHGRGLWLTQQDAALGPEYTVLLVDIEMQPKFWVPPLVGPALMESTLRKQAKRTSAGIERCSQ